MQRKVPSYPDYIKRVKRGSEIYEYFDTGQQNASGKRIYVRMPDKSARSYGGTYASLLAARTARLNRTDEQILVRDVSRAYQLSDRYRKRAQSTQSTYLIYLKVIEDQMGQAPIGDVTRGDIQTLLDNMRDRPGAANMALIVMKNLTKHAIAREWITADPARDVQPIEYEEGEYEPWPDDLIEAGLGHATLAVPIALLYFTGQRIGDVCKMRWRDLDDGAIHVRQEKTGAEVWPPIHPRLQLLLDGLVRHEGTLLAGRAGKPIRSATLRAQLQTWARGLGHQIHPHGLRKNAVIALLESGCSVGEISSITAQSLQIVEHYAKRFNRRSMARKAMDRWVGTESENGKRLEK